MNKKIKVKFYSYIFFVICFEHSNFPLIIYFLIFTPLMTNASKQILNIIFIGHVDSGKSTLGGQILNQLNLIDPRTLQKYKDESASLNRESWYLSWALDTNPEERSRGKTTELAKFRIETDNKIIISMDAPGHKLYITDMIQGANQADLAVLLISARKGELESGLKGQTFEHVVLSKSGGVKNMVVLINKMDEIEYKKEMYDQIKKRVDPLLRSVYKNIEYIPISAYKNVNIKDNNQMIEWYDGMGFLEYLDQLDVQNKRDNFVFVVTEKIKNMGMTLLEGKIESGSIKKNDTVYLLPTNTKSNVTLYDDEDVEIEEAFQGDNIKLRVKCDDDIYVITDNNGNLKVVDYVYCFLRIMNVKNIISRGYTAVCHFKNLMRNVRILDFYEKKEGKIVKKKFCKKGDKVYAKIKFDNWVVVDENEKEWFSVRDETFTVAVGNTCTIEDIKK